MAKVVDDFLKSRPTEDIRGFIEELQAEFPVGKMEIGGVFRFSACELDVGRDDIELSMWDHPDKLVSVDRAPERRRGVIGLRQRKKQRNGL